MNPVNYANGLLAELAFVTKKADKDAIKAELSWASEEIQKLDVAALEGEAKHFFSDVATRLAAALDAK